MTSTMLKWIALFTMIIDHIGLLFFPQYTVLRIIGRISFPIFAFLLVQGFTRTHSRVKYAIRLGIFAIIAEIPYDLCFSRTMFNWNSQSVLLELFIGFLALICLEQCLKKNYLWIFGCALAILLALITNASYGIYGIVIIMAMFAFRKTRGADVLAFIALTYAFYGIMDYSISFLGESYTILQTNSVQMYACFAAVLLAIYNNKLGKKPSKWMFYIVYPVHLLVLWFLYYVLVIGTLPPFPFW
ncbi:MAG: TraX family protein [Clostridia bacterium]